MTAYLIGVGVILLILAGGYWVWARRVEAEIAEGAGVELARLQRTDPELVEGVDAEKFHAVYRRVQFPRFPAYALACISTFLLATPVFFALLAGLAWALQESGIAPQPRDIVGHFQIGDGVAQMLHAPPETMQYYIQDVSGFFYFFGLLAAWTLVVIVFMRRYHQRAPGDLREEILRAR